MKTRTPTIVELFDAFFTETCTGQKPAAERRTRAVRSHLEAHLNEHGWHILTTGQLALLRAEEQFHPEDAFVRTMFAHDLLFALPRYLEPEHRPPGPMEARSQITLVGKMAQWMWNRGLFSDDDLNCSIYTLESALTEARRGLAAKQGQGATR